MVKMPRGRAAETSASERRWQDFWGLLLFFLGAAGLLCLCWKQPGLLPAQVDAALRLLAGSGAYALPVLTMFAGAMFLTGYQRLSLSRSSLGSLLLFLIFITARHIALVSASASLAGDEVRNAGGMMGGLFGAAFLALLGPVISYLLLTLLTVVAVLLLVDQPFIVLLNRLHQSAAVSASAASRIAPGKAVVTRRVNALPNTQHPTPDTLLEDNGAERRARVVERALVGSGKNSPPIENEPAPPEDAEEPRGKSWNLFNLTKPLFGAEPEAEPDTKTTPASKEIPDKAEKSKPKKQPEEPAETDDAETIQNPKSKIQNKEVPLPVVINADFKLPPLTLLKEAPPAVSKRSQEELTSKVHIIEQTLEQFNIGANVVEVASGPSVTRYEIQLAPGIKVSKIVSLADNLAMSMAAIDVRVEAPIPGKSAIGVEVPNATPMMVSLRECLERDEFKNAPSMLTFALGKDVAGQYKYADLAKMPHLLIGGSTNSGKSVCLNVIIASLLYRATPRDVRLLMIDPKRVELSLWDGIPHLMHPVVKDVKQAAGLFRAAIKEMDRRYDMFSVMGTRNLEGYNSRVPEAEKLPFIVLIVDELADLMMQQGPEIEQSICRLAQLARATGIHLVLATQRPSVDIITGTIKANIGSRIAFAVASQVDSRTILDMAGADRLIGRGDMLYMPIDVAKPVRVQGSYLSEGETNALVEYLKSQEKPQFAFTVAEGSDTSSGNRSSGSGESEDVDDQFFEQAARLVVNNGQASTSMLQRRFRIGYTRAARIVEMMEERGIVGPLNGAKPRELLVGKAEIEQMFNPGGPVPGVDDYEDETE